MDLDAELTLPQGSYRFRADFNGVPFWSSSENACTLPGCESAVVTLPGGRAETDVTIDYTYDPLYRLTAADYSDGNYYHYAYDAVGNRLSQDSTLHNQPVSTGYAYDAANRLTTAGGVAYTWDANGNLLNDGTTTYAYDSANRLTAVSGGQTAVSYTYDGLGNRLQQFDNGTPTTYVNDLNAGLTQVLSDGENTYLYGNGRIAQENTVAEYFLGDALGSVRQLTDAGGAVTYAANYDPYGNVLSAIGDTQSSYGYTGEDQENGMVFLRARYYSSSAGRFLTRDTWGGDTKQPMSYNDWLYVYGNLINGVDPSGKIPIICTHVDPIYWSSMPECQDYAPPPDTVNFNERIPPAGITFAPSRPLEPALIYYDANHQQIVQPGTENSQFKNSTGKKKCLRHSIRSGNS